jgi:hypothetical protein
MNKMKKHHLLLIIGIIIGIVLTLLITQLNIFNGTSPKMEREAIVYAQKLIVDKYGKEKKMMYSQKENPNYEGIEFPPISKTKIEKTKFDTYVITFYANYHTERCVRYLENETNRCTNTDGDSFYIELEYNNNQWNEIESRRLNPYK